MPMQAPADADLWGRIFPGVPALWVIARLALLGFGAAVLFAALGRRSPLQLGAIRADTPTSLRADGWSQGLALAATLVALYFATAVRNFERAGEALWFFGLAIPALVLASSEARGWCSLLRTNARSILNLFTVPGLWLAFSLATAWRSPRAASIVDMWIMIDRLRDVVTGAKRALSDSATPGHSNAYMMLEGLPWMRDARLDVTYVDLQAAHFVWALFSGVAVGLVAWRLLDRRAAPVAQAVFLFSPYALASAYSPGPTLVAPMCTIALLGLWLLARDHRSLAATAAFGAVAGFSGTEPTAALIGLLLCAVMGWMLLRMSPLPWIGLTLAPLIALAATLPALPNLETLSLMADKYTFGRRQLVGIQAILFGQESPARVLEYMSGASPFPYDLPIGALLAPVAIARTPLRLWGDSLLDPLGGALAAAGVLLCVGSLIRSRAAGLVFTILLLSLLQGSTAAGDAVSHGRLAAALVPLALLAAATVSGLRRLLIPRRAAGWFTGLIIFLVAAGGAFTFTRVNPRLLAASWLTITLQALGSHPIDAEPILLTPGGTRNISWLFVDRIAELLPSPPVPVRSLDILRESTPPMSDQPRIYFWSPALHSTDGPDAILCDHHPGAAVFQVTDEAGLYSAYAAVPTGARWTPRVERGRWSVRFCDAPQCGGRSWTSPPGSAAAP